MIKFQVSKTYHIELNAEQGYLMMGILEAAKCHDSRLILSEKETAFATELLEYFEGA